MLLLVYLFRMFERDDYTRNISISTSFDYSIPIGEQIQMIKSAGFSHVSIGGNYEHSGILDEGTPPVLKQLLTQNNLSVDTIHGYNLDKSDSIEINKKIVDVAVYLGAPVVVIHCSSFTFRSLQHKKIKKNVDKKLPAIERLAKESGIRFAVENVLPGVATDLAESIIQNANPEYIGFCYDSSHDQVGGPNPFVLVERLKDRLLTVHISDRIKEFVDHVLPGEGFIDFNSMCGILHSSPYRSPLLMEVMITNSQYKNPVEFLNKAYQEATELYDNIY